MYGICMTPFGRELPPLLTGKVTNGRTARPGLFSK
jgi:hypothetical protein